MTPSILSLTFNDLTSLNRGKTEINTSKSKTEPHLCWKISLTLRVVTARLAMFPVR